jgi:hypothetical protein
MYHTYVCMYVYTYVCIYVTQAIGKWGSHRISNRTRIVYAAVGIGVIVVLIAAENALLLSQDVAIYASVTKAQKKIKKNLKSQCPSVVFYYVKSLDRGFFFLRNCCLIYASVPEGEQTNNN